MLKHVQISPMRNRADSVSLRSSISCSSSLCGSPEPLSDIHSLRTTSRASSYSSLNEVAPQTTIKIFTSCLRIDIEYKTLGIQWETTAQEVVRQVLRRCKMRHRDPRLFYLSMEVTIRKAGVKTLLKLEDEARPALLQACHPKGDSRFCLQMRPGGLIRVHTSALQPTSQYKSLVIAEETTSDELLGLLLSTYNSIEPIEQFSLYEVCPGQEYQRKLHPDDLPLRALQQRTQKGESCHFLVRRNPNYPRRRQLLPPINETGNISASSCTSIASTVTETGGNVVDSNNNNSNTNKIEKEEQEEVADEKCQEGRKRVLEKRLSFDGLVCLKCKNSFKSCEFCSHQKTSTTKKRNSGEGGVHFRRHEPRKLMMNDPELSSMSYNPVYNIREIRTVCHSFSSLGIDKKLLDIQINHKQKSAAIVSSRRASVSGTTAKEATKNHFAKSSSEAQNKNSSSSSSNHVIISGSNCGFSKSVQNNNNNNSNLLPEQVNANGKFLYI